MSRSIFLVAAARHRPVKAGQVRALAVTGAKALADFSRFGRRFRNSGLPASRQCCINGIVGPADMPRPIVDKLNAALREALASTEVSNRLALEGAEPMPTTLRNMPPTSTAKKTIWSAIVKKSGARLNKELAE